MIGQFAPQASAEDVAAIGAMLEERHEPVAPLMPSMSMKSTWHSWIEMVSYSASRYAEGDQVCNLATRAPMGGVQQATRAPREEYNEGGGSPASCG